MLKKIFISIQKDKEDWLGFSEGKDLEDKLALKLRKSGFTSLNKEDFAEKETEKWEKLKEKVRGNELILNEFSAWTSKGFIYSPYGSQKYPDFLVFTERYIIPIELKASTKEGIKPMWNSHLPKFNGLYVFASFGKKDITFFRGVDVIDKDLSNKLIGFFEEARKTEEKFVKELENKNKSERGWKPYIRIAYDQVKSLLLPHGELNYFDHPRRGEIENKVLEWLEDKD